MSELGDILWKLSTDQELPIRASATLKRLARRAWVKDYPLYVPAMRFGISRDYKNIYQTLVDRDGERCVYCGTLKGKFHIDHIVPLSLGGTNRPDNLQILCASCNIKKSNHFNEELWV